jgi:hypothetical protein
VDFRVSFDWYNASGTLISTTSQPAQAVPAGQWTFLTFTATAPALTTSIVARVRQGTTPPASSVYHVWGLRLLGPGSGAALSDTFSRTNSGGWGSADTGQTWSTTGGAAADYAVNGTVGQHVMNTRNILRYTYTPASSADVDVRTDWAMDKTAVTDSNYVFLMARYTDTTHLYFARVQVSGTGQAMTLTIRKRNGAEVQVGGSVGLGTYTPGTFYTLRLQVTGSTLQAKCWQRGTLEPDAWQITTTDTACDGQLRQLPDLGRPDVHGDSFREWRRQVSRGGDPGQPGVPRCRFPLKEDPSCLLPFSSGSRA